jgi:hypothetical protein
VIKLLERLAMKIEHAVAVRDWKTQLLFVTVAISPVCAQCCWVALAGNETTTNTRQLAGALDGGGPYARPFGLGELF